MGISLQQFNQMKERTSGKGRAPKPAVEPESRGVMQPQAVILGVDPSLRGTGFGVIRAGKGQPEAIAHGTIHCPAGWDRSRCLARVAQTLREVVRQHRPGVCVIEGLFYAQNLQTALIMGEARGAALCVLGEAGMEIYEVAPRKVKQAIVGYGAAQKLAVAKMVQRMLRLTEPPEPDAADALALALTHAQQQGRYAISGPKRI